MKNLVCIDSNAMTYLVEAMTKGGRPVGSEAEEKVALLRLYLYRNQILYITPTVRSEYEKMKEGAKKRFHTEIDGILLDEIVVSDQQAVDARASEYNKDNDCHILAEAEIGDAEVLLTYDQPMLKRLRNNTKTIKLCSPTEYWRQINIPLGSRPVTRPSDSNPLARESWWIWK